jgi:hypothetical protein
VHHGKKGQFEYLQHKFAKQDQKVVFFSSTIFYKQYNQGVVFSQK